MKIEIKGNDLVITLPMDKPFQLSGSGKSYTVASSRGVIKTDTQVDGKFLNVGVNAYIENENFVKPGKGQK